MKVTLTKDNEQIQLKGKTQDIINILEYINQDKIQVPITNSNTQVPTTRNGIEVTNLGNSGVTPYIYIGEVNGDIKLWDKDGRHIGEQIDSEDDIINIKDIHVWNIWDTNNRDR